MNGRSLSKITALTHLVQRNSQHYKEPHLAEVSKHEAVVCSDCGAVYQEEHWSWKNRPKESRETLCPACLRIQDRMPAGILTVRGDCLREHRREILDLVRRQVKHAGKHHPLKRIMDVEDDDNEAVFTFTDEQLTREVGDALHRAYDGVLDCRYNSEQNMIKVTWQR